MRPKNNKLVLFSSRVDYKFTLKSSRPYPVLQQRKAIVREAMELHSQMYTAFAEYV